jgi:D-tyrosyl-tRNA(Tyr) deacylase
MKIRNTYVFLYLIKAMYSLSSTIKKSILVVSTNKDAASLNIAKNLLKYTVWNSLLPGKQPEDFSTFDEFECDIAFRALSSCGDSVYLWLQNSPLLRLDFADQLFLKNINEESCPIPRIDEIIFLSKHAAKSGTKSLTVHPIGKFVPQ